MDSAVPSECCVCGVPIGVKGGVGGTLQSTSGLWICFGRRCWKQHEAVFCPDNERLMEILNRRRDAESDARMAAHLYADAMEHATKADAERDAALKQRDEARALLREARGILDADGVPLDPIRAFAAPTGAAAGAASSVRRPQRTGRECPECHNPTLAKVDGCDQCGSCGWIGSCG